jgi:hypothetical protein
MSVMSRMDSIAATERAMEVEAYPVVVPEVEDPKDHQHVAIAWRGGVIWLDMSDQSDHFCVDVRQFVETPIDRQRLAQDARPGHSPSTEPLLDPDGTPVRGHGCNGGYVITLMHDKERSEKQTNRPAGPGRG